MSYFNVTGMLEELSAKGENQEKMELWQADKQLSLTERSREGKAASRLEKIKAILGIWQKMLDIFPAL